MKNLLYKELRLAIHPTSLLFLGLSAMMLIPNYPLSVTFFYSCLSVFFLCLSGRENKDLLYTMLLPVRKRDLVQARILTVVLLQLAQLLLCLPFIILRGLYPPEGNLVGMDANIALLGFGLVLLGAFNFVFFRQYYRAPGKVGVPFLLGCGAVLFCILLTESLPHFVPFVRDCLDTPDPLFLPQKLLTLGAGALVYVLLTLFALRSSTRRFEMLDL